MHALVSLDQQARRKRSAQGARRASLQPLSKEEARASRPRLAHLVLVPVGPLHELPRLVHRVLHRVLVVVVAVVAHRVVRHLLCFLSGLFGFSFPLSVYSISPLRRLVNGFLKLFSKIF